MFSEDKFYIDMIEGNLALEEVQKDSWKINNDGTADWALEKIRVEKSKYQRIENVINSKIMYLQEQLRKENEEKDGTIQFFTIKLEEYFRTIPKKSLKVTKTQKTYILPSGKLQIKSQNPELLRNEDELLKYFKDNNLKDFIKVEETPKWGEFKKTLNVTSDGKSYKILTTDGEILECVTVQERPNKFIVEVD